MKGSVKKTALITGASRGLGFALAEALARRGWNLLINGRDARQLLMARQKLQDHTTVEAISGDIIDEIHLLQFPERLRDTGPLTLVVNNASTLGMAPQPPLLEYPVEVLHRIFHTNVIAPLSLLQKVEDHLVPQPVVINISSDAGVEAYPGWGGYGSSKAALDHLSAILAKEHPEWRVYAVDPGDMRTGMHRAAFPGEDISDRPLPETYAVPALLHLIDSGLPSGRYIAREIVEQAAISIDQE